MIYYVYDTIVYYMYNYNLMYNVMNHTMQLLYLSINQFTSGILYFFPVPHAGLFSVKIRKKILAIKNFSVNETMSGQPNKCLIH